MSRKTNIGMLIHPIRNEQDHRIAVVRIEELMSATASSAEGDELDVLATLVAGYEEKRHPTDAPDPISAIRFRMEQQKLSRRDLEPMIGSRARVSEVLTGRRPLTLEMMRRLTRGLGISADLLLGPPTRRVAVRGRSPEIGSRSKRAKKGRSKKAAA